MLTSLVGRVSSRKTGTSLALAKSKFAMNNPFKFALTGALCALPSVAVACSCAPPPAPKIALEKSAAVFVGKVTSVEKSQFSSKFQFSVSKKWKGIEGNTASIVTASDSAACGINFDENRDYLIYAFKSEGDDQLRTNLCTRTKRVADAADDLAELGAPVTIETKTGPPGQMNGVKYYRIAKNGEVQLDVTKNLSSTERPATVLLKAMDADEKSRFFRLNWNSPINSTRGSALYNRADSTLKVYSRSQNGGKIEVRSTLYSGVTRESLKQWAFIFSDGKNSLPVGITKRDLGSKIVQLPR